MLLSDAGIPFTERSYTLPEWPKVSKSWQAAAQAHGASQTAGQYDGRDSSEQYLVDAVADVASDWRNEWVIGQWSKDAIPSKQEAARVFYARKKKPRFINTVESYLRDSQGPYLLGERITYADILLYGLVHDEVPETCNLAPDSRLLLLYHTVGQRPGIAAYVNAWKARIGATSKL
ncbi:hypothetical protein THASP1DRAFT_28358 [Thamnocephalis sphaerospora]|uniref:GST C-terminal domain-containing protein n=1 Tax=Thamnocephalis sphaerospora TaxID=78915 RepID=A0A4P9XUE0_9FUNG|nr:hypothetical protein THASP1DRAFT_28358 [Thamnocephalis sphaerospora]|eukprot:RKP09844.1 hypothetical protein THASP1DRAFT_28358 [Thamnocephalis sphaerospora]